MAVKKSTSSTPRRTSRGTKIDFMKATNNIGNPIAAVAGFAVGKYALKKLEKSQTVSGLLGNDMKTYIVPAAITMGGLVGTQFTKNEYVKLGLVGAAGAGVESIIKKATGKTILQGFHQICKVFSASSSSSLSRPVTGVSTTSKSDTTTI